MIQVYKTAYKIDTRDWCLLTDDWFIEISVTDQQVHFYDRLGNEHVGQLMDSDRRQLWTHAAQYPEARSFLFSTMMRLVDFLTHFHT